MVKDIKIQSSEGEQIETRWINFKEKEHLERGVKIR